MAAWEVLLSPILAGSEYLSGWTQNFTSAHTSSNDKDGARNRTNWKLWKDSQQHWWQLPPASPLSRFFFFNYVFNALIQMHLCLVGKGILWLFLLCSEVKNKENGCPCKDISRWVGRKSVCKTVLVSWILNFTTMKGTIWFKPTRISVSLCCMPDVTYNRRWHRDLFVCLLNNEKEE
jgi:hypothetical protein